MIIVNITQDITQLDRIIHDNIEFRNS